MPPSHPPLNSYTLGCCDAAGRTIYINNVLSARMMKKVLCHEIVHATIFSYGIKINYDEEEKLADIISTYGSEIISLTNSLYKKIRSFR